MRVAIGLVLMLSSVAWAQNPDDPVRFKIQAGGRDLYKIATPLPIGDKTAAQTEVDVLAVDGTVIREAGRPPWAGGWKRVGERHPGWSQEKADRFKAKFGACFPPGQCKDKTPDADEAPAPTP